MTNITLVGCGLVGGSWAVVFARAGLGATLYDPSDTAFSQPCWVRGGPSCTRTPDDMTAPHTHIEHPEKHEGSA